MPRTKDKLLEVRRRQQILSAAEKVFIEKGFHQSSMREVIEEAGLSTGAVYNYFRGKADIVGAICEEERKDIELLLAGLQAARDPSKALCQLVYDIVSGMTASQVRLAMEISAEACRNETIRKLVNSNDERLHRGIVAAVREGQNQHLVADFDSPAAIAEMIRSIYEGFVGRLAYSRDLKSRRAANLARLAVARLLRVDVA